LSNFQSAAPPYGALPNSPFRGSGGVVKPTLFERPPRRGAALEANFAKLSWHIV